MHSSTLLNHTSICQILYDIIFKSADGSQEITTTFLFLWGWGRTQFVHAVLASILCISTQILDSAHVYIFTFSFRFAIISALRTPIIGFVYCLVTHEFIKMLMTVVVSSKSEKWSSCWKRFVSGFLNHFIVTRADNDVLTNLNWKYVFKDH